MNTQSNINSHYAPLAKYTLPKLVLPNWLISLGNLIASLFNVKPELKVWQAFEKEQIWWHIYNSSTGQYVRLDSEAAACSWIEQHYYYQQPAEELGGNQQ